MKVYKLIWNVTNLQDLENELNKLAKEGYKVICSLEGMILILEREVK